MLPIRILSPSYPSYSAVHLGGSTLGFYNLHHRSIRAQNWGIYFWILPRVWVSGADLQRALGLSPPPQPGTTSPRPGVSWRCVRFDLGRSLKPISVPGKPVAHNHGLLSKDYGLLRGTVVSYFLATCYLASPGSKGICARALSFWAGLQGPS